MSEFNFYFDQRAFLEEISGRARDWLKPAVGLKIQFHLRARSSRREALNYLQSIFYRCAAIAARPLLRPRAQNRRRFERHHEQHSRSSEKPSHCESLTCVGLDARVYGSRFSSVPQSLSPSVPTPPHFPVPSVIVTIRSTPGTAKCSTLPPGQCTSMSSTLAAGPRPKCGRGSLLER